MLGSRVHNNCQVVVSKKNIIFFLGGEDSHFDSLFFWKGWNKPPTRLFKWKIAENLGRAWNPKHNHFFMDVWWFPTIFLIKIWFIIQLKQASKHVDGFRLPSERCSSFGPPFFWRERKMFRSDGIPDGFSRSDPSRSTGFNGCNRIAARGIVWLVATQRFFIFTPKIGGRFPIGVETTNKLLFFDQYWRLFWYRHGASSWTFFRVLASNIWTMCIRASKSVLLPDGLINTQNPPSCLSKNLVNYSKLRYENRSHIPCS